jgi:hypothetical protein
MYWHWFEGDFREVGAVSLRPFLLPAAQGGNVSAFSVDKQKPHLSRTEKAAIVTNASAWTTIRNEAVARKNKTDRLREERLAREASERLVEKPKRAQNRKSKV